MYGDRCGVVDEPDQPAASLGSLTYRRDRRRRARRRPPGSTRSGVGVGERVAIVSHNAARLLTSLFGVSGSGADPRADQLPPQRRGGRLHRRALGRVGAPRRPRARRGAGRGRGQAPVRARRGVRRRRSYGAGREPAPWAAATRTPPRPSTTPAAPPPARRASSSPTATSGSTRSPSAGTSAVNDRDVYLHTLPMFHCNGWGMPYARRRHGRPPRSCCARSTAPRSCAASRQHGRHRCCAARPTVVNRGARRRAGTGRGEIPGRGRVRIVVAGAPPPTRTIERVETELGWEFIQIYGLTETAPLLTMNRGPSRVRRPRPRPSGPQRLARAGAPARRRPPSQVDADGEVLARGQRRDRGLLGAARGDRRRDRRRLVPHRRRRPDRRRAATSPSPTARRT